MPITDWPKEDRPREKLLSKGEQSLTDAELVAIFLKTGGRGKTALDIAKEILVEFGGLKKLLVTPSHHLLEKSGIGYAKYAALKAAVELGRRYLQIEIKTGDVLNNIQCSKQYLADKLKHHVIEVFACVFLDTHLRVICFEELFFGTVNEANVYPREILRRGLLHNAAKIILAHNHPSGNAMPSTADKELTRAISAALSLVDMMVVDHIIVGDHDNFSFAERGLM